MDRQERVFLAHKFLFLKEEVNIEEKEKEDEREESRKKRNNER